MMLPALDALGRRIVILGPSGAGKSTLAGALAEKLGFAAFHLDAMYHQPNTRWLPRAPDEFEAMHNEAIAGAAWVMDGNYSRLLPARLRRATGVIWIDVSRWAGLLGYTRRSLADPSQRRGRLEGAPDGLNWKMTRYILIEQPRKRPALADLVARQTIPVLRLRSMRELRRACAAWGLERPTPRLPWPRRGPA